MVASDADDRLDTFFVMVGAVQTWLIPGLFGLASGRRTTSEPLRVQAFKLFLGVISSTELGPDLTDYDSFVLIG